MATGGEKSADFQLVKKGTLELEDDGHYPGYTSIVLLSTDLLLVIDSEAYTLRLHFLHDGKLLATSERMESAPWDVCVVREKEVAVTLRSGQIVILSVEHTGRKTSLTRERSLNLATAFDRCHGVRTLEFTGNLVVSGVTCDKSICWGLVSLADGYISTIHKICRYEELSSSYLTTSINYSTVYISCRASLVSSDNGVYAFDITTGMKTFMFSHKKLTYPRGISVDTRGFIYVCNNWHDPSIYQLTDKGGLVTIYRERIPPGPWAMCWQKEHELMYVTSFGSKEVWYFHPVWSDQEDSVIPMEILDMDAKSVQLYKEALRDGKEKVYNIRVMVVGPYGVGKTMLTKRLLGQQVFIAERKSTEGIDVYQHCCKISLDTGEWTVQHEDSEQLFRLHRLQKLLMDPAVSGKQKEHREVLNQRMTTPVHYSGNGHDVQTSSVLESQHEFHITLNQPEESSIVTAVERSSVLEESSFSILESKGDATMEILHLLEKNIDRVAMSFSNYAMLSMWDFAGQYLFYTTHQAFLTHRAIYLLVTDLSQQVTDLVRNDEYYFNAAGARLCQVQDLVEGWLNSIHYCTPGCSAGAKVKNPAAGSSITFPNDSIPLTPPVILVGTHVDKISEDMRQSVINTYYRKICYMLKDKPTSHHLVDFFAIDNTERDPQLEILKRRIFEISSQQRHWGEEVPANWLPLEEALMRLKASGIKVIRFSQVVELNKAASVPINTAEKMDLFLKFLHETGIILYFSEECLRKKIVLDPQWFIDALKSLMTAEVFILRNNPAIRNKWFEFKEKGKLTPELIDAIWTKEKSPEFYDHKDHILCLMEKMNIISRPGSYCEDSEEVKVEDYFLAPFMLRQATPKEFISPEATTDLHSTSALCFVFTGKFLPVPIFHRLLASCVAHWPIAKQRSVYLIFCGCCIFDLDFNHRLILYFKEYIIFVRVTRMVGTDICQTSKLCHEARNFIFENLTKLIGNSLQFELHVQCPNSDADSLEGLIAVSLLQKNKILPCHSHDKSHTLVSQELLQFWFEEKESSSEEDPYAMTPGPIIPIEILRMDDKSLRLYKKALRNGKEKVYNIRVMVVGQYHVGKTTLAKRLLGQQVDISERRSTEGIDVYKHCCRVSQDTGKWISQLEDSDQLSRLQRLVKILTDETETPVVNSENEWHGDVIYQKEKTPEKLHGQINYSDDNDIISSSSESDYDQEVVNSAVQLEESFSIKADQRHVTNNGDAIMSILRLLNENTDKLEKSIKNFAALSMWDFAGQYVFYSTHQTFLTSRAIYLLVSDLSQQITDLVKDDECYFDTEGVRLCQVQDLVEVWLNSIHCCAQSTVTGTPVTHAASKKATLPDMCNPAAPPVILVGTHVDKIPEDKREQVTSMYFQQVCRILKDKPTIYHLVDFFAIDNTQLDPQLEVLKTRILELASKQPYWGEERPSSWIILEEALMKLKESGVKVIPLSLVEELNQGGSVPIKTEELDLFLRFQHELGAILYFSVEGLRERIVLDPQWLIDALKSLITAQMFIFMRSPAILDKWFEFRDKGKLTPELIDAIWTKETNPEFHDNKKHILLLMEKLNIVARTRLYSENEDDIKMEKYFLAPCMLQQRTPKEIICPEPHPQMESSSVLCYVFSGKFLPSPIFHRLLAACVAHWPIATKKTEETQENLIFCGCGVFQLDQYHKLTLHFRDYVIFMRLTRKGITDKTPSSKLCIKAREFVTAMLLRIIGYLGQSLKFEYFIQCPEYRGESVNSLIPVSVLRENKQVCCDFHDHVIESDRLLNFWFEDVIPDLDTGSSYSKAKNY